VQARFCVSLFALALVFLPDPVSRVDHATADMPAEIEKLLVFPAGKYSFYPELQDLGTQQYGPLPPPGHDLLGPDTATAGTWQMTARWASGDATND
jgi:hypothetical protein